MIIGYRNFDGYTDILHGEDGGVSCMGQRGWKK